MGVGVEVGTVVTVGTKICVRAIEVAVSVGSDSTAVSEGGFVGAIVSMDRIVVAEAEGMGVLESVCATRAGRLQDRAMPIIRFSTMMSLRVLFT